MRLSEIRAFFKTYLDSLGLSEWKDGFNTDNIPSTLLNKSYHIEIGPISSGSANQLNHVFDVSIKIRVFLKGYRYPGPAIDQGLEIGHQIYETILAPGVRLQTEGIKDVRPVLMNPIQVSESNDNDIILECDFSVYATYVF